jgi:hypothetical protein
LPPLLDLDGSEPLELPDREKMAAADYRACMLAQCCGTVPWGPVAADPLKRRHHLPVPSLLERQATAFNELSSSSAVDPEVPGLMAQGLQGAHLSGSMLNLPVIEAACHTLRICCAGPAEDLAACAAAGWVVVDALEQCFAAMYGLQQLPGYNTAEEMLGYVMVLAEALAFRKVDLEMRAAVDRLLQMPHLQQASAAKLCRLRVSILYSQVLGLTVPGCFCTLMMMSF